MQTSAMYLAAPTPCCSFYPNPHLHPPLLAESPTAMPHLQKGGIPTLHGSTPEMLHKFLFFY